MDHSFANDFKLPPLLGLMPLEVLLVEGNIFRVPARRVWEKDGMCYS
jgi:hypothetical protein